MKTSLGFNGDINPYMVIVRYIDPDYPCSSSMLVYPGEKICYQNKWKVCQYIANCDNDKRKENPFYANLAKSQLDTVFTFTY